MKLNWLSYYIQYNSYGIFSSRMVKALQTFGANTVAVTYSDLEKPKWMLDQMGIDWDNLTIICNEPRKFPKINGEVWLFTMCEGSVLEKGHVRKINKSGATRIVVPCQFVKDVMESSGVKIPLSIVPLGIDPEEFPLVGKRPDRPYTFLTLADRGDRKGWTEVFDAFYKAFGGRTTGTQDVRLIIKSLVGWSKLSSLIVKHGTDLDTRITWEISHYDNMADLYSQVDCVVLPSRSEGWGLPHREAAVMGLPVILQKYAGLDDGHTEEWALTVDGGRMLPIPEAGKLGGAGNWMVADIYKLAERMRSVYDDPERASRFGLNARNWLLGHQTWMDSAAELINLISDERGSELHASNQIQLTSNAYDGERSQRVPVHDFGIR